MASRGAFGRAKQNTSTVVPLGPARQKKRASRYLPLLIGGLGFVLMLFFLNAPAGLLADKLMRASEIFDLATTSVDRSFPAGQSALYFSRCHSGGGTNCVVDGDTFWINSVKVRISDIDAPETHPPRCAHEAALGDRATNRLQALLNSGPIELRAGSRDEDVYGRKLRIVTRDGHSLGMQLVSEGLARSWGGAKRPWCSTQGDTED